MLGSPVICHGPVNIPWTLSIYDIYDYLVGFPRLTSAYYLRSISFIPFHSNHAFFSCVPKLNTMLSFPWMHDSFTVQETQIKDSTINILVEKIVNHHTYICIYKFEWKWKCVHMHIYIYTYWKVLYNRDRSNYILPTGWNISLDQRIQKADNSDWRCAYVWYIMRRLQLW